MPLAHRVTHTHSSQVQVTPHARTHAHTETAAAAAAASSSEPGSRLLLLYGHLTSENCNFLLFPGCKSEIVKRKKKKKKKFKVLNSRWVLTPGFKKLLISRCQLWLVRSNNAELSMCKPPLLSPVLFYSAKGTNKGPGGRRINSLHYCPHMSAPLCLRSLCGHSSCEANS